MSDETRLQTPQGENSVLRRAGQFVLSDDLYDKEKKAEAQGALDELEEMQRRIREQASRCWGQYHVTAEEVRAQQEKDAISDLVTKELDRFKDEQRQKEEAEAERLRHLYRGIMGPPGEQPKAVQSYFSGYPPQRYAVEPPVEQPTCYHLEQPSYPTIISSAVNLTKTPIEKSYQRHSIFSDAPLPLNGSSRHLKGQQRLLSLEPSVRPSPQHSDRNWSSVEVGRRSRRPERHDDEVDEIERLLKLNQGRLKRLDCLRI